MVYDGYEYLLVALRGRTIRCERLPSPHPPDEVLSMLYEAIYTKWSSRNIATDPLQSREGVPDVDGLTTRFTCKEGECLRTRFVAPNVENGAEAVVRECELAMGTKENVYLERVRSWTDINANGNRPI
jgi:hypothetical protein